MKNKNINDKIKQREESKYEYVGVRLFSVYITRLKKHIMSTYVGDEVSSKMNWQWMLFLIKKKYKIRIDTEIGQSNMDLPLLKLS